MAEIAALPVMRQIIEAYSEGWVHISHTRLLFVINEGGSVFPHMEAYADLADEYKALKFTGNYRWFELFLSKPNDYSEFTSLKYLERCICAAKRFSNDFSGIVCADITDWANYFDSTLFTRLLCSFEKYAPSTVFAFSLYCGDKAIIQSAEKALLKFSAVSVILDPEWKAVEKRKQAIGFTRIDER